MTIDDDRCIIYLFRLKLIPIHVEQKADIPKCMMRIVAEPDHHQGYGAAESDAITNAEVGQPLRIEWSLVPQSGN